MEVDYKTHNYYTGVSIRSLNLIKWEGKEFRLVDHVSSKWRSFAILLGIHTNVQESWEEECHWNSKRCWNKVMDHWLTVGGPEDYPNTWEGLYTLLDDVECTEVAKDIKEIVIAQGQ